MLTGIWTFGRYFILAEKKKAAEPKHRGMWSSKTPYAFSHNADEAQPRQKGLCGRSLSMCK